LTEFLPVSSTGHLILVENFIPIPEWFRGDSAELFNVVIQCGAVLAVVLVFTKRLKQLLLHWREPASQDYLLKLITAFVLTGIGGLLLKKAGLKLQENAVPVAWATLIGGFIILGIERWLRGKPLRDQITWPVAIAVGLGQLLAAVFPGTSRSGATILMAVGLGVKRPLATEFSFLLGIPTLLSAGGLEIFTGLRHGTSAPVSMVLLGAVAAAATAFISVKWLLRFVQSHTFDGFGWYRIALGIAILAIFRALSLQIFIPILILTVIFLIIAIKSRPGGEQIPTRMQS
jgi:undecaprenyl-diphosphatase